MMSQSELVSNCVVASTLTRLSDRYSTFVRIGSGLSYADYIWIRQKPWKPWGRDAPSYLQVARKGHDDKGDVYLEPQE